MICTKKPKIPNARKLSDRLANTSNLNAKKKTGPEAANATLLVPYSSSSSS